MGNLCSTPIPNISITINSKPFRVPNPDPNIEISLNDPDPNFLKIHQPQM
jgi:hypothetical protein